MQKVRMCPAFSVYAHYRGLRFVWRLTGDLELLSYRPVTPRLLTPDSSGGTAAPLSSRVDFRRPLLCPSIRPEED